MSPQPESSRPPTVRRPGNTSAPPEAQTTVSPPDAEAGPRASLGDDQPPFVLGEDPWHGGFAGLGRSGRGGFWPSTAGWLRSCLSSALGRFAGVRSLGDKTGDRTDHQTLDLAARSRVRVGVGLVLLVTVAALGLSFGRPTGGDFGPSTEVEQLPLAVDAAQPEATGEPPIDEPSADLDGLDDPLADEVSTDSAPADSDGALGPAPEAAVPGSVSPSVEDLTQQVVVHVAGAVVRPGVYRLEPGARVADVVMAGGGADSNADLARTNLAAPLQDGSYIYIPTLGEPTRPELIEPSLAATDIDIPPEINESAGWIDINTATAAELQTLPGIGPVLAAEIIVTRLELGGFTDIASLREVPGIGDTKLQQIRNHLERSR